jgi:hypothetical protein
VAFVRSIDRRKFLILASAVAAVSLLPLPGYPFKKFASKKAAATAGDLAEVVEEYLNNFPKERDVGFLCQTLGLKLENAADRSFLSQPIILDRIQQDFENGRVASLAGWTLSRTEARVLVLLSLPGQGK